jgi:lipoprotein-anchoring transpeptidase ErfK/SrfK
MLRAAMARHTPEEPYLVVNRAHDSLDVRQGSRLLMRAPCASGSGKVLTARWQTWKFTSPRGRLSVLKKVVDPIWTKPAWAFIEENERMPTSPLDPARFDSTAMGEYGLHLGDGFLIHGTIYPVVPLDTETHGCVRLESDPLATVFETAVVGTPVYFY